MSEPLLTIENLEIGFETEEAHLNVIEGISFEIREGEIFGIVGESGSGKSVTALSIMHLLDSNAVIEADRFEYKGQDLLSKSETEINRIRGSEISMIFQDPMSSLNPVMSVGEQIAEVVRHHGDTGESTGFWSEMRRKYVTGTSSSSRSWQRAVQLLDTVGIPDPAERAHQYPHQLSGGMQQRVMIAAALAGEPSLLIADEPTTALDVSIEAQILEEILALRNEFDMSVLFISHDLGVVKQLCDRLSVVYAGKIMESGTSQQIFENPRHPYTLGLMGSIPNIVDDSEWLNAIPGTVVSPENKVAGCPFRDRCQYAFDRCDKPLQEYLIGDEGHSTTCHIYHPDVEVETEEMVQEYENKVADGVNND